MRGNSAGERSENRFKATRWRAFRSVGSESWSRTKETEVKKRTIRGDGAAAGGSESQKAVSARDGGGLS